MINGSFETFRKYNGINELTVAEGWIPFWAEPPVARYGDDKPHYDFRPEYKQCGEETNGPVRAISGFAQQWFNSYAGHRAGIYQRTNRAIDSDTGEEVEIRVGDDLQFSIYMLSWHSQVDNPGTSIDEDWIPQSYYGKRVGVDPTGGIDWQAETVVWSAMLYENDVWLTPNIDFTAENEYVTVFVYGEPKFAFKNNNCYVDEAELVVSRNTELTEDEINALCSQIGQEFIVPLNPDAALCKAALALNEGAQPISDELHYFNQVFQAFRLPGEAVQHWFRCPEGQFDTIVHWERED